MRTESLGTGYLALPDGAGPHPAVVVIHEASGLNEHARDVCRRFAEEGHAALGVDLFEGRNRAVCMARMFAGAIRGDLDHYGVPALKQALGLLSEHPSVDAERVGAIGFCLGGSIVLTWGCTDSQLTAIAPFYGAAPKPQEAVRRLCPVVRSWPEKDFTTKTAGILEAELSAAGRSARSEGLSRGEALLLQRPMAQLRRRGRRRLLAARPDVLRRAHPPRRTGGAAAAPLTRRPGRRTCVRGIVLTSSRP
jgi:carboxymethylenebutenolidase